MHLRGVMQTVTDRGEEATAGPGGPLRGPSTLQAEEGAVDPVSGFDPARREADGESVTAPTTVCVRTWSVSHRKIFGLPARPREQGRLDVAPHHRGVREPRPPRVRRPPRRHRHALHHRRREHTRVGAHAIGRPWPNHRTGRNGAAGLRRRASAGRGGRGSAPFDGSTFSPTFSALIGGGPGTGPRRSGQRRGRRQRERWRELSPSRGDRRPSRRGATRAGVSRRRARRRRPRPAL